ncbi:MAG: hypothetical protein ACP6IU_13865 [Candidatus Asgardarchaeia archaeon]
MGLIDFFKRLFSPKVKPISYEELVKPKAPAKKVKEPSKVPETPELKRLKELEAERESLIYERKSVQERIKMLDDKFQRGEISAVERDREFGKLLRTAVKLRRKLNSIEDEIRKLKAQIAVAA